MVGLAPRAAIAVAEVAQREVFRTANLTVDRAIEWLRGRDRERRFALWVHVYDPHQHVITTRMPEPYYRLMREDSARRGKELLYFVQQEQGYPRDELSGSFDRYDAQIAFVDAQVQLTDLLPTLAARLGVQVPPTLSSGPRPPLDLFDLDALSRSESPAYAEHQVPPILDKWAARSTKYDFEPLRRHEAFAGRQSDGRVNIAVLGSVVLHGVGAPAAARAYARSQTRLAR